MSANTANPASNPFNPNLQGLYQNTVPRLVLYQATTPTPSVPLSLDYTQNSTVIAAALSALQNANNLLIANNSNPAALNPTQINALSNCVALWANLSAGSTTFSYQNLADIVVVTQAFTRINSAGNIINLDSATLEPGIIATVRVSNAGIGYVQGTYPQVPVSGGTGVDAYVNVTVVTSNSITAIAVANVGTGYNTAGVYTNVPLMGGVGELATADVLVQGSVIATAAITDGGTVYGGSNSYSEYIPAIDQYVTYTIPFTGNFQNVPLYGGTGSGALGAFVVTLGVVTGLSVTSGGVGYARGDTLTVSNTFFNNSGSGFTANVTSVADGIQSMTINNAGYYYEVGDVLTLSNTYVGGAGSGFSANVLNVSTSGLISNAQVVTGGAGYLVEDPITVANTELGNTGVGFVMEVTSLLANPIQQIVDPSFPAGANTVAVNDGYALSEQPGTGNFFVSNDQDFTTWNPVYGVSESQSDQLVAMDVLPTGFVIPFGTRSMEYWYDVSDQGAITIPFERQDGYQQNWGLAAIFSRARFQNSLMFLGRNDQGSLQVLWIPVGGFIPIARSTGDIEHIINSYYNVTDAFGFSYRNDGHDFYQLNFPTAMTAPGSQYMPTDGRSLLFDGTTNIWSELNSNPSNDYGPHLARLGVTFNDSNIVSDWNTGNIYILDNLNFTDNGNLIRREFDTKHIYFGGNMFGITELYVDMARGSYVNPPQGTQTADEIMINTGSNMDASGYLVNDPNYYQPKLSCRVSTDGGMTFGREYTISLGENGNFRGPRQIFRRLGWGYDIVLKFTMTAPMPFIITGMAANLMQSSDFGR